MRFLHLEKSRLTARVIRLDLLLDLLYRPDVLLHAPLLSHLVLLPPLVGGKTLERHHLLRQNLLHVPVLAAVPRLANPGAAQRCS